MKARKIAAVILAVLMLVSFMPVMAEEAPVATVEVTSAPVQVTPAPVEATEIPAEESTVEPVAATADEVTPEPEATDSATDAPATEAPATEVPATEAPATEVPATEAPATEVPATEAPATEIPATEAPTEAPVYEPVYAVIPADTELFADKAFTEALGELTGAEILRVVEEDEVLGLYAAIFDTKETVNTASVQVAYFHSEEAPEWLTEEQTEVALESMKTYRKANGEFVPYIDFTYPEPDPTEAPDEIPVVGGEELIVEELTPVEPETTEEAPVEETPAVEEDGLIVEELAPVETEEVPVEEPAVEDVLITETSAEETVIEAPAEVAAPECSVVASMYSESESAALGDTVTVKAELIGYEGLNYTCEWECAVTDETGAVVGEWQSTGITALEHSFVLDETNAHVAWRLRTVVEA